MLVLGIDTGGTYTDGVILNRDTGQVLCTAKALTTPQDLTIGMENCIHELAFERWQDIGLVSLSTTLATNAIVEGRGGRVGLLLLGQKRKECFPAEICVELNARVGIRGDVREQLRQSELHQALLSFRGRCDALAISGYASVRNPAHELKAAQEARESLGIPVVCGHELTGTLGLYERTLTAILNARLIPIIQKLMQAVQQVMARLGVHAPIMVVRGDGSFIQANYAVQRPVETILSGPAASVIGAKFLSGHRDCLVVDMGGTTTDIACLHQGECAVSDEGARLSGWHTRVRALEICTFGLGGDSAIDVKDTDKVKIGPRKIIPLCRAKQAEGEVSGLTPTDVLHVTGDYQKWDIASSAAGVQQAGVLLGANTIQKAAKILKERITMQLIAHCQKAMHVFQIQDSPVLVGVGAPACIWLPEAAEQMHVSVDVPTFAEVANAIGAAVGQIRETSCALIRFNKQTQAYLLYTEKERLTVSTLEDAREKTEKAIRCCVSHKAKQAGAHDCIIKITEHELCDSEGRLIELRMQAVACGDP